MMSAQYATQASSSRISDIQRLLEHVLLSPSSFNLQHCRFVLISDHARLTTLASAFDNTDAGRSGCLLVIVSDIDAWQRIDAFVTHLPPDLQAGTIEKSNKVYGGKERVQRDEAFRSSGLTSATLIRLAEAENMPLRMLDCVDPDAVAQAICLPSGHAIGYCFEIDAAPVAASASHQLAPLALMHTNRYPRSPE